MILYYQIALVIACAIIVVLSVSFRTYRTLAELEIKQLKEWSNQLTAMLKKRMDA